MSDNLPAVIGNGAIDIIRPAVTPEGALKAWEMYEDMKRAIIKPEDVQRIQDKQFLKKSYWRKIRTFFNISVDVITETREELPHGDFAYHFVCKAIGTNGVYSIGSGSCTAYEDADKYNGERWESRKKDYESGEYIWTEVFANSVHNVRTTAETRAFNRAVSNLVGGGEVSAEEIKHEREPKRESKAEPKTESHSNTPAPAPTTKNLLDELTPFTKGENAGKTWRQVGADGVHALDYYNEKNKSSKWYEKNKTLYADLLKEFAKEKEKQEADVKKSGDNDGDSHPALPTAGSKPDNGSSAPVELSEFEKFTKMCVDLCFKLNDGEWVKETKLHLDIPENWQMVDIAENDFKLQTFNNMIMAEIKKRGLKI